MKSLLTFILILIISATVFCACAYDRGIILFNTQPINKQNMLSDEINFKAGERVYYLFIAPKRMQNKYIRVQVFKRTEKAPWGGNEVIRTKDFRLMKDERYYHTDYFTFHEKGKYVMQVFSTEDYQHPLAIDFFFVN